MCDRCAELEEQVAWLKSELGMRPAVSATYALARALRITPGVAKMLAALHSAKGNFLSTYRLLDVTATPGREDERDPNLVKVGVWRIRQAMGRGAIITCYGKGYQLSDEGMAKVSAILRPLDTPAAPGRVAA